MSAQTIHEFQPTISDESLRLRFKQAAARILSNTVDYKGIKVAAAQQITSPAVQRKHRGVGRVAQFFGAIPSKHAARTPQERFIVSTQNANAMLEKPAAVTAQPASEEVAAWIDEVDRWGQGHPSRVTRTAEKTELMHSAEAKTSQQPELPQEYVPRHRADVPVDSPSQAVEN